MAQAKRKVITYTVETTTTQLDAAMELAAKAQAVINDVANGHTKLEVVGVQVK